MRLMNKKILKVLVFISFFITSANLFSSEKNIEKKDYTQVLTKELDELKKENNELKEIIEKYRIELKEEIKENREITKNNLEFYDKIIELFKTLGSGIGTLIAVLFGVNIIKNHFDKKEIEKIINGFKDQILEKAKEDIFALLNNELKTSTDKIEKDNLRNSFYVEMLSIYNIQDLQIKTSKLIKLLNDPKYRILTEIRALGYVNLGVILQQENKPEEAKIYYCNILEINPKNENILYALGLLYHTQNKFEEAIKYYEKVLELNSKNEIVLENIGLIYKLKNNVKKAKYYFENLLKINPKNESVIYNLALICQQENNLAKAKEYFKVLIKNNPKNDIFLHNLGLIYQQENRLEEAEIYFKKAITENLDEGLYYYDLSMVYLKQNKLEEAEICLKKMIEIDPENKLNYCGLGIFYEQQNKLKEAEDYYKKSINTEIGLYNLGLFYYKCSRLDEAEICLKNVIKLNQTNEKYYYLLGLIFNSKKDFYKAIEYFKKAVIFFPDSIENIKNCYKSLGKTDEEIENIITLENLKKL